MVRKGSCQCKLGLTSSSSSMVKFVPCSWPPEPLHSSLLVKDGLLNTLTTFRLRGTSAQICRPAQQRSCGPWAHSLPSSRVWKTTCWRGEGLSGAQAGCLPECPDLCSRGCGQ